MSQRSITRNQNRSDSVSSSSVNRLQHKLKNRDHINFLAYKPQTLPHAKRAKPKLPGEKSHPDFDLSKIPVLANRHLPVQTELCINRPGDKYEQEANHIAEKIVNTPDQSVQPGEVRFAEKKYGAHSRPLVTPITSGTQKRIEAREKEDQSIPEERAYYKEPQESDIYNRLYHRNSGGQPLPNRIRTDLEKNFRADFSRVRVHTDDNATRMSRELGAEAFTYKNNIYFGSNRYTPHTTSGKKLLCHELTHVIQQRGIPNSSLVQRKGTKQQQAARLKQVNDAALKAAKKETGVTRAEPHWAKKLSANHLSDISNVITYLDSAIPDLKEGTEKTKQAMNNLAEAVKQITETKKKTNRLRAQQYQNEISAVIVFIKAKKSVDNAITLLKTAKTKGISGLDSWIKKLHSLSRKMENARSGFAKNRKIDLSIITKIRSAIKQFRTRFQMSDVTPKHQLECARNIQFVLRYFLAVNQQNYTKSPTLKESTSIRTRLGSITSCMEKIFGGDSVDYQLFDRFENQLREQIWVREKIHKALNADPGIKPEKISILKWFGSMKSSSNKEVITAYRKFASGFFIHRNTPDPDVIQAKQTLNSIFSRPTRLSGSRLLVCSGYAVLGRKVLQAAGARFKKYYIGIRASNQQVKCGDEYSDVHAIAYLTRPGPKATQNQNLYVSNDDIVQDKKSGLGPSAVTWDDKNNPIYEGSGRSIRSAVKSALRKINRKKRKLGNISCTPKRR